MTPKEKAQELFVKYSYLSESHVPTLGVKVAKQCALLAVDEIIEATKWETQNGTSSPSGSTMTTYVHYVPYWQEVKEEIEKL